MTPALRVAANTGPLRSVKGSPPVTASHGYIAGSVTMRATTTVAVSLAPRRTPHAIATPGAAKASDMPCTSRDASAPCTTVPGARTSPASRGRNKARKPQRLTTQGTATSAVGSLTLASLRKGPPEHGYGVRGETKEDGCALGNERARPLVVTDDLQHFVRAARCVLDFLAEKCARHDGRGQQVRMCSFIAAPHDFDGFGPDDDLNRVTGCEIP